MQISTRLLFFLLMFTISPDVFCQNTCQEQDYAALRALYLSTDGDNWNDNIGWFTATEFMANPMMPEGTNVGVWEGITTNAEGCVTDISMHSNRLEGTIPPEIGDMNHLTLLALLSNQLEGSIPPEIGNLSSLTQLFLSSNYLSGNIPPELGNLSNLTYLALSSNALGGDIPSELGQLNNLTDLSLYNNALEGNIPPELGNLTNLVDLSLGDNQLSGEIPIELGNLTNLETLRLSGNQLTGSIPTVFTELPNLTYISVSSNQLGGCYDAALIPLCSQISTYNFNISYGNNFDAPWEDFCANGMGICGACQQTDYTVLRAFYLSTDGDNWNDNSGWLTAAEFMANPTPPAGTDISTWYGIGTDVDGCITSINLPDNQISGNLSGDMYYLVELQDLDLSSNQLTGNIPLDFQTFFNLESLNLSSNQLTGSIPPGIGNVTSLTHLYLDTNQLTGSIPRELGMLNNLSAISLNDNDLIGCYDIDLMPLCGISDNATMSAGNNFDTSWENFCTYQESVCINCRINDYTALRALYLSTDGDNWEYNSGWLTAAEFMANPDMPAGTNVDDWEGVTTNEDGCVICIDMDDSNTGCDPAVPIFNNGNNLQGNIPPEIGQLEHLTYLNLSNNYLTGNIPTEIANLTNLTLLYLSSNSLSGNIPLELTTLSSLQALNLNGNLITGNIPVEIANLSQLRSLGLSGNALAGEIPVVLGDLTELTSLSLSGNELTGNIPPVLGNLTNLRYLLLSSNNLEGNIPPALGNLVNLNGLTLHNNKFTGNIPSQFGNFTNMRDLYLSDNELDGNIPVELGNLLMLDHLFLDNNQLSGSIPREIGNLQDLRILYLSFNNLSGCYPSELTTICSSLNSGANDNEAISNGNNFDASWEDFCDTGAGICTIDTDSPDQSTFAVYPVPAKDFVVFDVPNIAAANEIILYDITGRQISRQTFPQDKQLVVSYLNDGVYIYRIFYENEMYSGKIVVE